MKKTSTPPLTIQIKYSFSSSLNFTRYLHMIQPTPSLATIVSNILIRVHKYDPKLKMYNIAVYRITKSYFKHCRTRVLSKLHQQIKHKVFSTFKSTIMLKLNMKFSEQQFVVGFKTYFAIFHLISRSNVLYKVVLLKKCLFCKTNKKGNKSRLVIVLF